MPTTFKVMKHGYLLTAQVNTLMRYRITKGEPPAAIIECSTLTANCKHGVTRETLPRNRAPLSLFHRTNGDVVC